MAFGRHVLSVVPSFDVHLGAGALGFGEETLFCAQLLDAGLRLATALDAQVEHHFDLSRVSRHSLLSMAERVGRSDAYIDWHWRRKQLRYSRKELLRLHVGLMRRRLPRLLAFGKELTDNEWEVTCIQRIAFIRQYFIESRRPRRYRQVSLPSNHEKSR